MKSRTPKIEPCGTPPYTGRGADHVLWTLTVIVLFERKVANNLMVSVLAPFLAKAPRQCWKLNLLNALA